MDSQAGEQVAFFFLCGAEVGMFYGMGNGLVTFPSPLLSVELSCWCGSTSSSAAQRHLTGM